MAPDAPTRSRRLLDWYDRHHRELPWRVAAGGAAPGVRPDPYRVWLSEIMLQQTTVEAVKPYFRAFVERWPDVDGSGRAPIRRRDEGVGRARLLFARPQPACLRRDRGRRARRPLSRHRGRRCGTLPGIGAYTAAAIAAIAFDRPAAVVDGNVERVVSRPGGDRTRRCPRPSR